MSAIPAAIDALIALAGTVLPGVQVIDSAEVTWAVGEHLAVGIDDAESGTVGATSAIAGLRAREDITTVVCMVWSASGDVAVKPHRDRADTMFEAFRAGLAADRRLGGICAYSDIPDYTYRPRVGPRGAGVGIAFRVQVRTL